MADFPLPEKVQVLINDTAAWYAMRASIGLSVRDDLQAVARLAIEESTLELREENEALRKHARQCDIDAAEAALKEVADELARLRSENKELKKDAERYRWIAEGLTGNAVDVHEISLDADEMTYEQFGEAIDAAMQEGAAK